MKLLLIVACLGLLCSCSSAPMMRGSINGDDYSLGPTSASDPRLQRPQFYMDESDSRPWLNNAPKNNR